METDEIKYQKDSMKLWEALAGLVMCLICGAVLVVITYLVMVNSFQRKSMLEMKRQIVECGVRK